MLCRLPALIRLSRLVHVLVLAASLQLGSPLVAQGPSSTRIDHSMSIDALPAKVTSVPGQLTLFADYSDVHDEHVVVYLVNRTDDVLLFAAQNSELYIKLEAQLPEGDWQRAETYHDSWCGNSYDHTPELPPETFFRFLGLYPKDGPPRPVRFRLYGESFGIAPAPEFGSSSSQKALDVISNTGIGRVSSELIEEARYDDLAARWGDFQTLSIIALGHNPQGSAFELASRINAIESLGRFPSGETLNLFEKLLRDENSEIRYAAIRSLPAIASSVPVAGEVLEGLLASPDPLARLNAVAALSVLPNSQHCLPAVQKLINDDYLSVRTAAVRTLASQASESETAAQLLVGLLSDPDVAIRSAAAGGLANLPADHRTAALLEEMLNDEDHAVRFAALSTLLDIAPQLDDVVPLAAKLLHDEDRNVRRMAAQVIESKNNIEAQKQGSMP